MVRLSLLVFILLIASPEMAWALKSAVATVDKNPVMENESFVLEVIADDTLAADALDIRKLQQQFIVGSTSFHQQTQMINFKTSHESIWSIVLIARQEGDYVIPALPVADKMTNPIKLKVIKPTAGNQTSPELFIKSQLSDTRVYVQQQLTLTVQLYSLHDLKRGSLTEPQLDNATIQQVGKDADSSEIIDGKRYRVITRTYAINPQQSGQFILKVPVFTGEIYKVNNRGVFSNFGQSKPVSAVGDDIEVEVLPIPQNYQGEWLPAELITLDQNWQTKDDIYKVGEPITRTLTLTAAGLAEEQLPDLAMPSADGFKVYPEQAVTQSTVRNGTLISQKVQSFAIVVNQPGEITLPEIVIPWWNVKTNQMSLAKLPAKTIQVAPGTTINLPPAVATPTADQQTQPQTVASDDISLTVQSNWLQWLFLAGWLTTCLAWWWTSRQRAPRRHNSNKPQLSPSEVERQLFQACDKNDAKQALSLLLPWVNELFGLKLTHLAQINNLPALSPLHSPLALLQLTLYSKQQTAWQGTALKAACKQIKASPNTHDVNTLQFQLNP